MKKILLIEDNDDIRSNTAEILELSNYEVIVAENGKIGVEKAISHTPDLIICDIMMPVLDGYGVLHAIHRNEAIKNTPFIFLTAKTERSDFRRGMELGADDYITKPFSGTELLNAVDSRLKKIDLLKKELSPDINGLDQLLVSCFDQDGLALLTKDRNKSTFKKRQLIYTEGNRPHRLYYVFSGKIKAFKTNDDGKELVIELYSAGDFIGYIPLLEGSVYKETAEALEDTVLAEIPKTEFEELVNKNAEVAKKFMKLLAKNVSVKEEMLLKMAYSSLRKKVAEAIMMVRNKYQVNEKEEFVIDIGRENLATIAGTATESLIRTLSDFKAEKLIDIIHGGIKILNEKKLASLAT
jgi:CRP/FNR family cyclic AMP-dependent transcriptional regulator